MNSPGVAGGTTAGAGAAAAIFFFVEATVPQSTPITDRRLSGFYAVLDRDDEALCRTLVGAAGARVVQVRLKPASTREILAAARMARRVTREHGALLVVNDRLDIALAVDADAVHLGQDDLPVADARGALGARGATMMIGVSTHDLEQVRAAVRAGADYLGFGPVFATATKTNPDPVVGVDGLAAAVRAAGGVPVVAIGGVTVESGPALRAAGAAAACAIAAVNRAADPGESGRRLGDAWNTAHAPRP